MLTYKSELLDAMIIGGTLPSPEDAPEFFGCLFENYDLWL